jgi:RsmE family RNA methyltransferase
VADGFPGVFRDFCCFYDSVNDVNLLLFKQDELTLDGRIFVQGRRYDHLRKVLRVTPGQSLRAGMVRGPRGHAVVRSVVEGAIELSFEATTEMRVPSLSVVIAVPRPKALSRMVQAAASFGLNQIDIVNAWRVDAAYFQSHKLEPSALAEEAWLGCEQGMNTYVPDVAVHRYFATFVDEVLNPRLRAEPNSQLLVGHPDEPDWPSATLESVLRCDAGVPTTLVLGPDGGFIERELSSLRAIGGALVNFGETVLRSEFALVAGLSQIALLRRFHRD